MAGSDDYVCNLTEASIEKAAKELGEDPSQRLSQVETFRQWIQQQQHITCPTDTKFLLRFLRHAKFSQLKARTTLEGFLTAKTENPEWLDNVDMADPDLWEFFETGYGIMPAGYLKDGTKLCIYRLASFDVNDPRWKGRQDLVIRAIFGLLFWLTDDENIQVNGIQYLQDFTGFTMAHMTYWGMDRMKRTANMQKRLPGRFKGFHYYNTGTIFEALMAVVRPILSKKFQDRIHVHGDNMENMYKQFGVEMLPDEYLPDDHTGPRAGSFKEIIAAMKAAVTSPEVRNRILHETSAEWKIDLSKKAADVPSESFRRLHVD